MSEVLAQVSEKPILFNSEIWKSVVGFEERYEVSNQGRIRSLSTYRHGYFHKIMSHYIQNKGYHYVTLRDKERKQGYAVHRLVLEAFVCPCPKGKQVAHWNGDPGDNRVENLRWATAKENIKDRARHGRTAQGEKAGSAKLDRKAAKTIKKLKDGGFSACEIAHLASVHFSTVLNIWRGETWKHL